MAFNLNKAEAFEITTSFILLDDYLFKSSCLWRHGVCTVCASTYSITNQQPDNQPALLLFTLLL